RRVGSDSPASASERFSLWSAAIHRRVVVLLANIQSGDESPHSKTPTPVDSGAPVMLEASASETARPQSAASNPRMGAHAAPPQSAAQQCLPRLRPGGDGLCLARRLLPPLRVRLGAALQATRRVPPLLALPAAGAGARPRRLPPRRSV